MIVEKAVATQLMGPLIKNNLEEAFQSAYKRCHCTETVLLLPQLLLLLVLLLLLLLLLLL